jgi:endonuclease/exonuclease/phosphatase family metal-dependent hydrolase
MIPKKRLLLGGMVALPLIGTILTPLLFVALMGGEPPAQGCAPEAGGGTPAAAAALTDPSTESTADQGGVPGLSAEQWRNAAAVIATGKRMQIPAQGIVVALATASQESGFKVYANDGQGGDLEADQAGIARSLGLPHEAVGTDHGSLGIFQQQWPWWGEMPDLMDPASSAVKFYSALLEVQAWESMPVTVAAQLVQRSAYPTAYADDEVLARRILEQGGDGVAAAPMPPAAAAADCTTTLVDGSPVSYPVPAGSGYTDLMNWGGSGSLWSNGHTGTDLSVGCGTAVLAATAGTVIVVTDQTWSGRWLVQVTTGEGKLTTWYAHMQALTVASGDDVKAGQQIGEVGDEGNSSGCHLHFEVHPDGGSIYEDNIDPTPWLRTHVGKPLPGLLPLGDGDGFVLSTFNVLGASHTTARGNKPGYASGQTRMRWALELLDRYDVDVVGFQEFQRSQWQTLLTKGGDTYGVFPSRGSRLRDTQNAVAWRKDTFELISADTVAIPYFHGKIHRMPVVLLREKATGVEAYFINVHNPASTRRVGNQTRWRREATNREIAATRRLLQTGRPVFLTGDMNEKDLFFCRYTAATDMAAANGGTNSGSCRPPADARIDWIFGPTGTTFASYTVDRSPRVQKITDHPVVLVQAQMPE